MKLSNQEISVVIGRNPKMYQKKFVIKVFHQFSMNPNKFSGEAKAIRSSKNSNLAAKWR